MADTKRSADAGEPKVVAIRKVRIGNSIFSLPADAVFDLQPEAPKDDSVSDKLTLYLDSRELAGAPLSAWAVEKLAQSTLRVEVSYRPHGPVLSDPPASLDSGMKNEGLDLIEVHGVSPPPNVYSGNYSYVARNPGIKTAKDAYFEFTCVVSWPEDPAKRNGLCRVGYSTPSGLLVEHFFQESQLADWRILVEGTSRILIEYQTHH